MKMNKKGFTLIELLAVIIILGVLMIIAIPSVTTYIQNSRKSAWVDTSVAYVKSTVNKVNEGGKLQFFTEHVLYLVPVGHEAGKSCVSVESGGQSPFSDTWRYAYVGVVYNGKGYDYYFIGEDGAGQGIKFTTQKDLNDKGTDEMYSVSEVKEGNGYKILADKYKTTDNKTYRRATSSTDTTANASDYAELIKILKVDNTLTPKAENSDSITKKEYDSIVIVGAKENYNCSYSPAA